MLKDVESSKKRNAQKAIRYLNKQALTPNLVLFTVEILLAALISFRNPLFESPDELEHYQFVRFLVDNRSLPMLEGAFPYTGTALVVHELRLWSVALTAGTVLLIG